VGPSLAEGEIAVQLERVAANPSGHPHGQVALVRVSRGDAFTDAGDVARVSYSGCHSWGIPRTCGDLERAVQLVTDLVGFDAQRLDALGGNMCAHLEALASVEPADDRDRRRLEITRDTIDNAMITYPPLARFPEVEDAGWSAIQAALRGHRSARQAARDIQAAATEVLS